MTAIRDAKATIEGLKTSLEGKIGMLSNRVRRVEELRDEAERSFSASAPGLDKTVTARLNATIDGLRAASAQLHAAVKELDKTQGML
jgi:hypothetical protein